MRLDTTLMITEKNIDYIKDYMEHDLVPHMNECGLAYEEMAFILRALLDAIDKTKKTFTKLEND